MSFPGNPDPDAQQQPLLVPPPGANPELIKLQQALAQQMQQQPSGPVYSPWEALNRVVSPLAGALIQRHLAKQQSEMQQAAMPEIAAALQSEDPLKAMMASHSHFVQQMALQYMPDWMKSSIGLRSKIQERTALDPLDVKKAGDIEAVKEPYAVKQAVDIQKGTIPLEVQKAIDIAKGTLPIDLEKARAGQAATYAGQGETARHNRVMEELAGKKTPQTAPFGQNPASLYGASPQ